MSLSRRELRLTVERVTVLAAFRKYQKYRGHIWITFANIEGLQLDKIQFKLLQGFSFPFTLHNNSANCTSCMVEVDIHKNGYSQKIGEGLFKINFPKNRAFFDFQCQIYECSAERSQQKLRMMIIGGKLMENYEQLGYHGSIDETLQENYSDEDDREILKNVPRVKRRRLYTFHHNRITDPEYTKNQRIRTEQSPEKLKLKQLEPGNLFLTKSNKKYPDFLQPACLSGNHYNSNYFEQNQFLQSKHRIQSKFRRLYSFSQSNTRDNVEKRQELPKISQRKQSLNQRSPKIAPSKTKKNPTTLRIIKFQKIFFECSENFYKQKKNLKSKLFQNHLKKYLQIFHKEQLLYESGGSSGKQTQFWIMRDCFFILSQFDELTIRVYEKNAPLVNFIGSSSISYNQFIANSEYTNQIQRFVMRNDLLNGILSIFFQVSSLEEGLKNQKRNACSTEKNHSQCSKGHVFGNSSHCPFQFQSLASKQQQIIMPPLKSPDREHKRKTLRKPTKKLFPSSQNEIGNETLIRQTSQCFDTLY